MTIRYIVASSSERDQAPSTLLILGLPEQTTGFAKAAVRAPSRSLRRTHSKRNPEPGTRNPIAESSVNLSQ